MDATGPIVASSLSGANSPSKTRSFSDPQDGATTRSRTLAPSPTFRRSVPAASKDDHDARPPTTPKPSRRPDFATRGLSLQMPSPSQFPRPTPLSPQLDHNNIYGQQQQAPSSSQSPVTSLPRHSRGLDFSRACTNLHHSTLAEGTPDSSPVITQKALKIPSRKSSISGMMLDSPSLNGPMGGVPWPALGPERSTLSSSVGSVNMLASESESNDSDEDASMGGDDNEDPIFTTPQVRKLQNPNAATPFTGVPTTPGGWPTSSHFSPAQASLMKTIRRTRLHKNGKRSRKSSSSASNSGYSSMASPRTTSPPPLRSIETAANGGYFTNWPTAARSRRESLALGTDGLHLSSGNDSGDEASANSNTPSTPGVVRRAVVRRGNLLPKTKGFARIRAALMEEAAPIDTDVRREAETIRQVRERDGSIAELDLTSDSRPQTAGGDVSSPTLLPAVPEAISEEFEKELDDDSHPKGLGMNFAAQASRNSGGMDYWNRYDTSFRTPPPNFARHSSSVMSDVSMDGGNNEVPPTWRRPRARSSTSDVASDVASHITVQQPAATNGNGNLMNDDIHLNRFKRRREDDFDISTIKRRAVSPGMSANNSPILAQSPSLKDANVNWGQPPEKKDKSQPPSASSETAQPWVQPPSQQSSRHGSGGSSISLPSGTPLAAGGAGGKKLGLQGMVDTNDGLMKMSIE